MKSDLFKYVTSDESNVIYTTEFVDYLIVSSIYFCQDRKCSLDYITQCICEYYGEFLKVSKLKNHIKDSFNTDGCNNYIISDNEKSILDFIVFLKKETDKLTEQSEDSLYSKLYLYAQDESNKFINIYSHFLSLKLKDKSKTEYDKLLFKVYKLLKEKFVNQHEYNQKFEMLNKIDSVYDNYNISNILTEDICLRTLSMIGINTIGQIKTTKRPLVDLLFIFDAGFYKACHLMSKPLFDSLNALWNDFNASIQDKEMDIIKLRFGFQNNNMTLEEIGSQYSLTRERVRQIEAKALRKLRIIGYNNRLLLDFLYNKLRNKSRIIEWNMIDSYINNRELSFILLVIYKTSDIGECKYDLEYNCLYDSDYSISDIVNDMLSSMPIYYSFEQSEELTGLKRKIFENNYKKYQNIYIRKNMIARDIFVTIVKRDFKDGFKTSNEEQYNQLKNTILNEVGKIDDFPSMHSLATMLERDSTLVLCDRGTVIDIENVNLLPEELYQRIIDYIYEQKPTVYYNSIFETFKYELKKYNINNPYLLKGLIDRNLPEDFYSRRDYISIGDRNICPYTQIEELIRSYEGIFSINDLKSKFNGVADYVFFNILYPEKEKGLIFLENKRFIYFDKLGIREQDKNKIQCVLEEMFESLNCDTISARKVYARIKLFEDKYDLHLKTISSYFDLFSVIRLLFPNEYYYSRPFISKNPDLATSREELLRNHLINYNSFTNKDVKEYLTKMNVGGIYSYLMFMENMSDNFVQIEMDKMVKKEVLNISDDVIRNLAKIIRILLNNYKKIDTRTFNGYSMFPKLKYEWNKYMLVGIIRSYMSDDFIIDNTENTYNSTDFIIRSDFNE